MKDFITKGFDEKTLKILKNTCAERFEKNPSKFFILYHIFNHIEDSFDNQAIHIETNEKFESLKPYIINASEKDDKQSLDELIKAFVKIAPL
jgi:hypothetical protein